MACRYGGAILVQHMALQGLSIYPQLPLVLEDLDDISSSSTRACSLASGHRGLSQEAAAAERPKLDRASLFHGRNLANDEFSRTSPPGMPQDGRLESPESLSAKNLSFSPRD